VNLTVRFLATLAGYGRGEGYLELRWRAGRGMRSEHFAIGELDSAAARALTLAPRQDVYVGATPRARRPAVDSGHRAGARSAVDESWVLWVDCDRPDSHHRLQVFSPRPALAVASGSGGTHAYWPLVRAVGPDLLEHANRCLALALDGDRQSVDAARILRPLGTLNHKHSPPRPVEPRWFDEGAAVELDAVLASLPELPGSAAGVGAVRPRDPRGDPLLAIPPGIYVPVLVGTPLNREGKVSCPLHDDRTPSLHAFGPGRGWRCFGCGAGRLHVRPRRWAVGPSYPRPRLSRAPTAARGQLRRARGCRSATDGAPPLALEATPSAPTWGRAGSRTRWPNQPAAPEPVADRV